MPGSEAESFDPEEIEVMIQLNKNTVEKRGQGFESDDDKIRKFFTALEMYDEIQDRRERVIKKAAHILGGLAWHQSFNESNKETSTRIAIYYLRKNGFDLPLDSLQEQEELFHLLVRTIEKFPQDQTIYKEIEEYLKRKVTLLS